MYLCKVPGGEGKENGEKAIFEEIMTEQSKVMKTKIHIFKKPNKF